MSNSSSQQVTIASTSSSSPHVLANDNIPTNIDLSLLSFGNSNNLRIGSNSNSTTPASAALNAKYRGILENLLKLKQDLVTASIKQAINVILLQHKTATSADWIRVIFKSFELIISTININHIYVNDDYLNECLKFLATVIETGNFLDLIQDKEAHDYKLFNKKMTTILNQVSAEAIYKNANTIFVEQDRSQYVNTLGLLEKSLSVLQPVPQNALSIEQISIWYRYIIPLLFDTNPRLQEVAIGAVAKAIPFLLISRHQTHSHWPQMKELILTRYTKEITSLFTKNSPKWYILWCLCIKMLDIEIPRSASTLNAFLSIVEQALRSLVLIRRAEGYRCWKVLLEVLVRHKRLDSAKRLKLVCTPLKSLQARTVEIAMTKLYAWWYVICNVSDNLDVYNEMVLEPYLQYCFGQLQTRPNIITTVSESAAQLKRFKNVSLMAILTLIRLLGQTGTEVDALFEKYSIQKLNRAVVNSIIFQNDLANIIINACGEATQMLLNLASQENEGDIGSLSVLNLTAILWTNLLELVNVSRNIQHIHLILDNLQQLLVNANDSKENKDQQIDIALTAANIVVNSAYIFSSNESDPDMIEKRTRIDVLCVNLIEPLSYPDKRVDAFLQNILITCDTNPNVDNNILIFYINEMFNGILTPAIANSCSMVNSTSVRRTFFIWTKLAIDISNWYKKNFECIKTLDKDDLDCVIDVTYNFLFWPLYSLINTEELKIFNEQMIEIADFLVALTSKKTACVQSAEIIRKIFANGAYCFHINDVIAKLIDYMDYEYNDINEAPVEILDLVKTAIENKNKNKFQDLNVIAEAIIKFYKRLEKNKSKIIKDKVKEIMSLIEGTKSDLRIKTTYIMELIRLIRDDKVPISVVNNLPKSNSNPIFVVVNKVWTLQPNRLTEHQKEKMKERRCDIPALYNDMSQSQDTQSIHEWAPKTAIVPKTYVKTVNTEKETIKKTPEIEAKEEIKAAVNGLSNNTETKLAVDVEEANLKTVMDSDKKNLEETESLANVSNGESSDLNGKPTTKKRKIEESEEKTIDDDKNISKRMARELSRIHIDTIEPNLNVELSEKRSTRSAKKALPEEDRRKPKLAEKADTKIINTSPVQQKTYTRTKAQSPTTKPSPSNSDSSSIDEISLSQSKTETPRGTGMSLRTRRQSVSFRALNDGNYENIADSETKRTRKSVLQTQEEPSKTPTENKTKTQSKNKQEENKTYKNKESPTSESNKPVTDDRTKIREEINLKSKESGKKSKDLAVSKINEAAKGVKENDLQEEEKDEREGITEEKTGKNKDHKDEHTKEKVNIAKNEKSTENTKSDKIVNHNKFKKAFDKNDKLNMEAVIILEKSPIKITECPVPVLMNSSFSHVNGAQPIQEIIEADLPDEKMPNEESPIERLSETSAKIDQIMSPTQNKSYMSTLMYDDNSLHTPNHSLNQSILTSPKVDNQRNLDFLNDTLNISPIVPDDDHVANGVKEDEPKEVEPIKSLPKLTRGVIRPAESREPLEMKEINPVKLTEVTNAENKASNASTIPTTPVVTTPVPPKQYRTSMHASTPLASNNSPITSRLKSSLTGRGAQLLKMINSNKGTSDTLPSTSSPTINQLQTAPINDNFGTPEPKQRTDPATNRINRSDYLTFTSVLPSPHESPGTSILKRKANYDGDDESMCSPAHKRKRVSFNFPLSETREYIVEDDMMHIDATPTNSVHSIIHENSNQYNSPTYRLKNKLKRKNRSDSMRDITKLSNTSKSNELENYTPHKIIMDTNEDEISVEHIKQYLENNRQKVETIEIEDDDINGVHTGLTEENNGLGSPSEPVTLSSFSDAEIFEHIFSRYPIEQVLQKYEESERTFELPAVNFFTNRLSSIMSTDKNVQDFVLNELAEQHSNEFLDHALTENLCATVCNRLSESSENGVVEYIADRVNNDKRFSALILRRLKSDVLIEHTIHELDIQDQQELYDRLFDVVDAYHKTKQPIYKLMKQKLPEHLHKLIVKIFSENRLSVDQFEEYTKLYILKKFGNEAT